jgi:hypothetical protein
MTTPSLPQSAHLFVWRRMVVMVVVVVVACFINDLY